MLEPARLERIRDELGHRPWHELGVEELARAAGVSRMTLHRRGVSKDAIGDGLATLLADEYREAALPALTASGPARERLAVALTALCRVDERYLGLLDALGDRLGLIFHEEGDGEVLTRTDFTDALRRILQDGVRDGTLRVDHDLQETATLVFNAAGWTYRHMRTGHRWSAEKATDRVVELLVAGVST